MSKKLRWGVIGCAKIAINAVIPGIQQSEHGVVTAIASRGEDKAKETAAKLHIDKSYSSYEALLQDKEIDAVYIPLPNHLHAEWSIKALEAGKHVLCEKPIALNTEEARSMAAASEKTGYLLAEAFMYRYHPRFEAIKEVIRSGEIGTVRGIHSVFTFNNAKDTNNVRYKAYMGGGSLYDVGCYPISVARMLLEQEPSAATVHGFLSPEHDYVDMMASGLLEFENGVALTFDCGMWAEFRQTLEILGTEGRIAVPNAFVARETGNFTVYVKGQPREVEVQNINQYAAQADHFAERVFSGKSLPFPTQDAINNMKVIDACMRSIREKARIVLD